jgi:hypothetical protein
MKKDNHSRFKWRATPEGLALTNRSRVIAMVVPDEHYPQMYRVRLPDGWLSDMTNLSRAKDAALSVGRKASQTAGEAPPIRLNRGA